MQFLPHNQCTADQGRTSPVPAPPPRPPDLLCASPLTLGCGKLTSRAGTQHRAYLPSGFQLGLAHGRCQPTGNGRGWEERTWGYSFPGFGTGSCLVACSRGPGSHQNSIKSSLSSPCGPVRGKGFPALADLGAPHSPPLPSLHPVHTFVNRPFLMLL